MLRLALPLAFLGVPGCVLYADLGGVVAGPSFSRGVNCRYSLTIPTTSAALLNFDVFTQATVFGAPTPTSQVTSDGIRGTIASR
jgi:hypothetical protein